MDGQQGGAPRFAELLDRAWTQHNLKRVATAVLQFPAEANRWTAVVHATVETDRGAFSAVGEANPETVGPALAARLVEAAETRAVGRALGWATNTAAAVAEEFAAAAEPGAGEAARREDHEAASAPAATGRAARPPAPHLPAGGRAGLPRRGHAAPDAAERTARRPARRPGGRRAAARSPRRGRCGRRAPTRGSRRPSRRRRGGRRGCGSTSPPGAPSSGGRGRARWRGRSPPVGWAVTAGD